MSIVNGNKIKDSGMTIDNNHDTNNNGGKGDVLTFPIIPMTLPMTLPTPPTAARLIIIVIMITAIKMIVMLM